MVISRSRQTLGAVWLTSNGIVKRLLGKVASLIGRIEDLVVENREVEREAETNGVSRGKVGASNLSRSLIRFQRLVGRDLTLVALGKLGKVAMIVALPETDFSMDNIRH